VDREARSSLELAFELIHIRFALDYGEHGLRRNGPSVPGDHGRLKPIKGAYCGSFKCALNFT